ncbi:MAG TPA: MBL fold metallo-hydrolase [Caldisericia bacterium]|nr:MBL fold metallo-hydrolase [Caldisericia bacterium]
MNYTAPRTNPYVVVLGIAQDGGLPHCGCHQSCCIPSWSNPSLGKMPVCLGIVDPSTQQSWMIEATFDFKTQWYMLQTTSSFGSNLPLHGIFLTHGHVGHYAGLLQLDKAILNSRHTEVFAMPKMAYLLQNNLPWKALIDQENIHITQLQAGKIQPLNSTLSIQPILVPHRDEYTETVGFMIIGPIKKILFIPDIDSWEKFPEIYSLLEQADDILVDGTFYDASECKHRNIESIPHPFIASSMKHFETFPTLKKQHFHFIHLNHTNPCLHTNTPAYQQVLANHFRIAAQGQILPL